MAPSLPADVAKGLVIARITLKLNEVEELVSKKVKGSLNVKVEVWKGGAKTKQFDYDEASSNDDLRIDSKVLNNTLHDTVVIVTRRAICDRGRGFPRRG